MLDIDQLHEALKKARRRGVRDARLKTHAPSLIELLYPARSYPHLSIHRRAIAAENVIVAAVESLDAEARHLLSILLCLRSDTSYSTLQARREKAAEHVGILPRTFRDGWREPQLFEDLTARIYRLHQANATAYIPQPADEDRLRSTPPATLSSERHGKHLGNERESIFGHAVAEVAAAHVRAVLDHAIRERVIGAEEQGELQRISAGLLARYVRGGRGEPE